MSRARGETRTCSVLGCEKPHMARNYCSAHYSRWKETGDISAPKPILKRAPPTKPDPDKILELYRQGLSNREIAKALGCFHTSISYWLKKNNLQYNREPALDILDEFTARCKKCKQIVPLEEFQYGRRGKNYEYRFAYCNKCRKNQLNNNLNNDIEKFLRDRWRRIVQRAVRENIYIDLKFSDILSLYTNQDGKCFYTGVEMVCRAGEGNRNALSFDKIVPENGYRQGNVVLCTNRVNTAKGDFTISEIKIYMPLWYERIVDFWRSQGLVCLQVAPGDF